MVDNLRLWAIPAMWLTWLAYWILAARQVKASAWRESVQSRLSYRLPMLGVALLFLLRDLPSFLERRLFPASGAASTLGAVLVAAGLGFAVWARRHLGSNWSGRVTVKMDHSLIRTGPYRYVRHPIYTGILLAFLGTAISIGEVRGFLALVLAVFSLVRKIGIEEERMRSTFASYDDYRQHTAALVPFLY
jgi:protein-S-isoprenylcysteine O-methyltransferase Ste14